MCFSSKMKVPKPTQEQLKAPEPVLLEPPKGIEVGDGSDDSQPTSPVTGRASVTIPKTGEGTQTSAVSDTGFKSPSLNRAMKRTT